MLAQPPPDKEGPPPLPDGDGPQARHCSAGDDGRSSSRPKKIRQAEQGVRHRRCAECGGQFLAIRSDARLCSARCRQSAVRRRKGCRKRERRNDPDRRIVDAPRHFRQIERRALRQRFSDEKGIPPRAAPSIRCPRYEALGGDRLGFVNKHRDLLVAHGLDEREREMLDAIGAKIGANTDLEKTQREFLERLVCSARDLLFVGKRARP